MERQEAACRKLCETRGWEVEEVFSDNDASAYTQKPRARYLELLEAIRSGRIDVVVAWHPDRLHRQLRELVPFIDLVDKFGVHVETVQAGRYDLSTPAGRMNAKITGSVAEYESEHKSARIRAKLEQNAAGGRHHGGSRPFGWADDRVGLDPAEAKVVQEAARLLLSGETVRGIARLLNEAGYKTSTGREWRDVGVREMLLRPRNAGIRVHHGEEVTARGQWEPILAVEDYRQIQAILNAPGRRTNPGKDGRVHLLSGLARCGVCGGTVVVGKGKVYDGKGGRRSGGKSVYRCRSAHVLRDLQRVEDFVTRVLLARLKRADAADLLVDPGQIDAARAAAEHVQQLQDRLQDAAEAYAAGAIDLAMMTTIRASLLPEIEKAKAQASSPDRTKVLADLVRDPEAVWEELTPERRRAVVSLLMDVTLNRTTSGPRFDPDAISIDWK